MKNKIIEVEGVVRDFRLFEKQVNLEGHKNQKIIEEKTKEVERLQGQNLELARLAQALEKKYAQLSKRDLGIKLPEI